MRRLSNISVAGVLIASALLFAAPLIGVLLTSLKPLAEIEAGSLFSLPQRPTFVPWMRAWASTCINGTCHGLSAGMANSVILTIPALLACLILGSITGFALSLRSSHRTNLLFAALMIGLFIPVQVTLFPMIVVLREAQLFGTRLGLIAVDLVWSLPFMTLLFRNFFVTVQRSVLNAARIDGASFLDIFLRVMLPMSVPVCTVAIVLQFTFLWNEFLLALIFSGSGHEPVTVALSILSGGQLGIQEYNVHMAGALIAALPTILLYLIAGRSLVRGFAPRLHG